MINFNLNTKFLNEIADIIRQTLAWQGVRLSRDQALKQINRVYKSGQSAPFDGKIVEVRGFYKIELSDKITDIKKNQKFLTNSQGFNGWKYNFKGINPSLDAKILSRREIFVRLADR